MTRASDRHRPKIWHLLLDVLSEMYGAHFPGEPSRDYALLVVLGCALLVHERGHPIRASKVAQSLSLPRETVRRKLLELVRRGVLAPSAKPGTFTVRHNHTEHLDKIAGKIRHAAEKLVA